MEDDDATGHHGRRHHGTGGRLYEGLYETMQRHQGEFRQGFV